MRPAHYLMLHSRAPQTAEIQLKRSAGGEFETVKRVTITDAYGYFDTLVTFPAGGQVRISSSPTHRAGGGAIHSRTVEITVR